MFDTLSLKPTYSSYGDDIGQQFYVPVLKEAVSFDRVSAYFSAEALAFYAKGLECFARKGNKYRLIISQQISEEDYNEIKAGYELKQSIADDMLEALHSQISLEQEKNISNLAYLISLGIIEIRFAFTITGIFHDKFGILKDAEGNIIDFRGSNNETIAAIRSNYESFQITCNWLASSFDKQKIDDDINTFDALWNNHSPKVCVIPAPDVIRTELLKFCKDGGIINDPVLLKTDAVILDITDRLNAYVRLEDPQRITNGNFFKLKLKRFVSTVEGNTIVFRDDLTYLDYIDIIKRFRNDAEKHSYPFFVTQRLQDLIDQRELYIRNRSRLGIDIKHQEDIISNEFLAFKERVSSLMKRQLRPKQMWDAFFMYSMKKSGNFSVPGSGKTSSVLGVYAYLHEYKGVDRIVVIGPKNAFDSWITEFHLCFDGLMKLNYFSIQSPELKSPKEKKYALQYESGNKNLFLFNYESLGTYEDEIKALAGPTTLLVYDEVHKVKAVDGEHATHALAIAEKAGYTIVMTGTPIPNTYLDLYNLLHILFPAEYSTFFGFSPALLRNPSPMEVIRINEKLQPFFCRTTKQQLMVPAPNPDILIPVPASAEETQLLSILNDYYRDDRLALIIRILQMESSADCLNEKIDAEDFNEVWTGYGTGERVRATDYSDEILGLMKTLKASTKRKKCVELVKQLALQGKSVIVWCIFIDSINGIADMLRAEGISVKCIYGSTSMEERTQIIQDFKDKKFQVLLTNPHTLAESVSLHSVCHDAVYFEYSYNLVHMLQSKDRIHRLGLPEGQYTQYYYLHMHYDLPKLPDFSLDKNIYDKLKLKEDTMISAIDHEVLECGNTTEEDIELILGDLIKIS